MTGCYGRTRIKGPSSAVSRANAPGAPSSMHTNDKVRVAIDCRISNPQQGIGTAVLALAHALSESHDVGQEYTFIVPSQMRDWIAPSIFGRCRLKTVSESARSRVKNMVRQVPLMRTVGKALRGRAINVPVSDGYVEGAAFDLVHFPIQAAYLTSLPSIYQPHDLQHVHYPGFFSKIDWAIRERLYRAFCEQAEYVCVQTEWSKQDIVQQYGIAPEKLVVIPWGLVFDARATHSVQAPQSAARRLGLPPQFLFYPAVTWPHKNHEVIFHALNLLKRERQRTVQVYFTGASTEFRAKLDGIAQRLGVREQLHYLGFVTTEELRSIYRAATAMVFPSKFEGFGLPLLEAFDAGLPVLCSNASVLPEVAQDAALYFDPDSPSDLAARMIRILDDADLRRVLVERGTAVLSRYSFRDTAAAFQRLYALTAARQRNKTASTVA